MSLMETVQNVDFFHWSRYRSLDSGCWQLKAKIRELLVVVILPTSLLLKRCHSNRRNEPLICGALFTTWPFLVGHETFLILLATLTDDLCLSANEVKSDVTFGIQIVNNRVNKTLEKQETLIIYILSLNRLVNDLVSEQKFCFPNKEFLLLA